MRRKSRFLQRLVTVARLSEMSVQGRKRKSEHVEEKYVGELLNDARKVSAGFFAIALSAQSRDNCAGKVRNLTRQQRECFSYKAEDYVPVFCTPLPISRNDVTLQNVREKFQMVPVAVELSDGSIDFEIPDDRRLREKEKLWFGLGGKLRNVPGAKISKEISEVDVEGLKKFLQVNCPDNVFHFDGVEVGEVPICGIHAPSLDISNPPAALHPDELQVRGITVCGVSLYKDWDTVTLYPRRQVLSGMSKILVPAYCIERFLAYLKGQ